MSKIQSITAFFIGFFCLLLCCSCQEAEEAPLKVMTWNIWHGGLHGPKESNFEKDSSYTENVYLVIQQEDPDILLMQETYCCGMDIARKAGFLYSTRASSNLSIHSKYPIVDSIAIYKPFNAQGAIIDVDGDSILFVNIWLHYLPDFFQDIQLYDADSLIRGEGKTRLREITAILHALDSLEKAYQLPIVIGGDFNSASHLDWVESTREAHYGKVVEWPVSKKMLDRGYTDSFREANPDPAKTLEGTWGYLSADIISDRIDYIYYKSDWIRCDSSRIVMEDPEGGFFNSDHRAIISYFRKTQPGAFMRKPDY